MDKTTSSVDARARASISNAIFPIEIFSSIINDLAHLQASPDKLQDVKSCAFVCKAFVELSRAHIFRELTVSLRRHPSRTHACDRFFEILEGDPTIAKHVRKLTLSCWRLLQPARDAKQLELLIGLPGLDSLRVINYFGQTPWEDMDPYRRRLISVNVSSGRLRSLDVEDFQDLSFDEVFSYPSLTTLRLDNCQISTFADGLPRISFPSNIKTLAISGYKTFPVSILLQASSVESLTLGCIGRLVPVKLTSEHACRRHIHPGRQLASLSMGNLKDWRVLIDAFTAQAKDCKCKPFSDLKDLRFDIFGPDDLDYLKKLLPDLFSLQSLSISGTLGVAFPFPDLKLHVHNRTTFSLKVLSLSFYCDTGESYYEYLAQLLFFFEAIESDNELEEFHLRINSSPDPIFSETESRYGGRDIAAPDGTPWSRLDRVLAPNSKFPKLKVVDIKLEFSAEDSIMDMVDSRPDIRLEGFVKRAMPLLTNPDSGVSFSAEVSLMG
ncbi:hypothetical protein BJ165DRAFT_1500860 [Panaeolus papilionaceus]|nr:hypothetical protein BJ165DRAFT_1500860 [Panaeolus papilionaceus]